MRPSAQQLYPVFAVLLVAAGSIWLERATRSDDERPPAQQRRDPDFTAETTRLVAFGKDGRRHFELVAERVTHYPQSGLTQLERPRLRYQTDGGELEVRARSGEVFGEGERLVLQGEVRAVRPAGADRPALSFESASLTVWPDEQRAETSDPVTLTQGVNTARADGMKTDNLFGTLELIGNARVHLPRPTRNTP